MKKNTVGYWATTALVAFSMIAGGFFDLLGAPVTGGQSGIHFQRRSGDPVIHQAAGWLGRAAEKSARAAKYG